MFDSLLAVQANQISSSADLTALEDLLQFLEDGGFAALPETTNSSSAVSVADPISQGLSLLPDFSQTVDRTTLLNEDSSESTSGLSLIPISTLSSRRLTSLFYNFLRNGLRLLRELIRALFLGGSCQCRIVVRAYPRNKQMNIILYHISLLLCLFTCYALYSIIIILELRIVSFFVTAGLAKQRKDKFSTSRVQVDSCMSQYHR